MINLQLTCNHHVVASHANASWFLLLVATFLAVWRARPGNCCSTFKTFCNETDLLWRSVIICLLFHINWSYSWCKITRLWKQRSGLESCNFLEVNGMLPFKHCDKLDYHRVEIELIYLILSNYTATLVNTSTTCSIQKQDVLSSCRQVVFGQLVPNCFN